MRQISVCGAVAALLVALSCGRIDDGNCLATRTCASNSAGQGGAAGASEEPASGGAELAGAPHQ